jgi:hypothetical protein
MNLDVDLLADRLAHGNLNPTEADAVWQQLQENVVLPMIQRIEEELDCDTLGAAADEKLRKRVTRYSRAKGRFPRWLERTLVNLARDEMRKRRRRGGLGLESPDQVADRLRPETDESTPLPEKLAQALSLLRETLDDLDSRPRARQQKTDYHAVLLLELRLAMAGRLRGHRTALAVANETRATLAARQIPWSTSEEGRQIQPGWPILRDVWQVLATELARADDLLTDDDLVRLLTPLSGVTGLTSVAWRQWRTRATQAAAEYLGEEKWERTIAGWL